MENFNILSCEGTTSNYIAFNTASKPYDDEWARKAVAYCIDRSQITTTIGGDYAKQSAVVPMSESMMYMDKDKWDSTIAESDVYTQDYDKVKETGLTPVETDGCVSFGEADLVLVCRKLYSYDMEESGFLTDDGIPEQAYGKDPYHRAYIAEITAVYVKE